MKISEFVERVPTNGTVTIDDDTRVAQNRQKPDRKEGRPLVTGKQERAGARPRGPRPVAEGTRAGHPRMGPVPAGVGGKEGRLPGVALASIRGIHICLKVGFEGSSSCYIMRQ